MADEPSVEKLDAPASWLEDPSAAPQTEAAPPATELPPEPAEDVAPPAMPAVSGQETPPVSAEQPDDSAAAEPDPSAPLVMVSTTPMSKQEYLRAQKLYRRAPRLFRLAAPALSIWLALETMIWCSGDENLGVECLSLLTVTALFALVVVLINARRNRKDRERGYDHYQADQRPGVITFFADHLEEMGAADRLSVPYTDIVAFYEFPEQFLLVFPQHTLSLSGRGLTAFDAQCIREVLDENLPPNTRFFRGKVVPMLAQPLPLLQVPPRPVVPPQALNIRPLKLRGALLKLQSQRSWAPAQLLLAASLGCITAKLIYPLQAALGNVFLWFFLWFLFAEVLARVLCRHIVEQIPDPILGLSLASDGGVLVYHRYGERYCSPLRAKADPTYLSVLVDNDLLMLPYEAMNDPGPIRRYFNC